MIHKAAIDYAKANEKKFPEIVELLSKGPIKKKISLNVSESISQENEFLLQKTRKKEEEIQKKDDELLSKQEDVRKKEYEKQIDALKEEYNKQIEALKEEHKRQLEEKDKEIQKLMGMIEKLQNQS